MKKIIGLIFLLISVSLIGFFTVSGNLNFTENNVSMSLIEMKQGEKYKYIIEIKNNGDELQGEYIDIRGDITSFTCKNIEGETSCNDTFDSGDGGFSSQLNLSSGSKMHIEIDSNKSNSIESLFFKNKLIKTEKIESLNEKHMIPVDARNVTPPVPVLPPTPVIPQPQPLPGNNDGVNDGFIS